MDVIANIVVFVPQGAISVIAFRSRIASGAGAILLSLLIEFLQTGILSRHPSWRDVACNGMGGILGATLCFGLRHRMRLIQRWHIAPVVCFASLCWIIWWTFPFVPSFRFGRVSQALQFFWSIPPVAAIGDYFFGSLILMAILRVYAAPALVVAALFICTPIRLFIQTLSLSAPMVAAVAAGALIARRCFPEGAPKREALIAGIALFGWLLFSQLQPFTFQSTPTSFSWLPLLPLIEGERAGTLPIICRKLLLYAGCIWMLHRSSLALGKATFLVTIMLSVTELIQPYLPGRTAEITDALLAIAAGVFLALYSRPTHLLE